MSKEKIHYREDERQRILMDAGMEAWEALELARMMEEYPFHQLEMIAAGIKKMARGKDQT